MRAILQNLANDKKLRLHGNGCAYKEFMVDFVLYEQDSSESKSGGIALAIESELSDCSA